MRISTTTYKNTYTHHTCAKVDNAPCYGTQPRRVNLEHTHSLLQAATLVAVKSAPHIRAAAAAAAARTHADTHRATAAPTSPPWSPRGGASTVRSAVTSHASCVAPSSEKCRPRTASWSRNSQTRVASAPCTRAAAAGVSASWMRTYREQPQFETVRRACTHTNTMQHMRAPQNPAGTPAHRRTRG